MHLFGASPWAALLLEIFKDGHRDGRKVTVTAFRDDDREKQGTHMLDRPVLSMDPKRDPLPRSCRLMSIVNDRGARRSGVERFPDALQWGSYIHPSVHLQADTRMDEGVFVGPRTQVCVGARLHAHAYINHEVLVSEFVSVGRFSVVHSRTFLGGYVKIGEGSFIGAGALVRDRVSIGEGSIVGMGAVVVKDVAPRTFVGGNPARVIREL